MGTRQRSARVDWVAADFPSKDAAKRTGRHFVFQRCERETRQHIKAKLPGSCSQSKFNRGSSTLTHPAFILYICLSDWLSCRRFTQKNPNKNIKKTQKSKPGMIYLHVCVVWLQKRPQQSAPSLAAAPASLHQVANMQEAGGSRSFQLRSQGRRSGMFRQGCVRVVAVFMCQILYNTDTYVSILLSLLWARILDFVSGFLRNRVWLFSSVVALKLKLFAKFHLQIIAKAVV